MSISVEADSSGFTASRQDGSYPRPQLVRPHWHELAGAWGFAFDDAGVGEAARWHTDPRFERTIQVPFPYESAASGIHDTGFHPTIWYSRRFGAAELAAAGFDPGAPRAQRMHLRFGAVDYRARVWVDGSFLGEHEGGQTPFSFDITDVLDPAVAEHTVVVRAEDDPLDAAQPRGKQDWRLEPHSIWYHRTSGIWQPVWLEATGETAVTLLHWTPDLVAGTVTLRVDLNRRPPAGSTLSYALSFEGSPVAEVSHPVSDTTSTTTISLPAQSNGQAAEELLWTPETPRLLDATVTLTTADGVVDLVQSYLGLRSAAIGGGRFLLNDRPYYVRAVLQQGYWPASHLASPSPAALRRDVELIKELGFNAARIHQKIEDPRFLYWADRLGLLVWGEAPGAFEFSATAMRRTTSEWTAVLERDLSHPSIVTWVPVNESWGVPHLAHDPAQAAFVRALVQLTRAIDPSRPVISNDGWEHVDSDIVTIHDYDADARTLGGRYLDDAAMARLLSGTGPAGRRLLLPGQELPGRDGTGRPVMLSEFGGISFPREDADAGSWGYSSASSTEDFLARLSALVTAVNGSTVLAGFCYTQLTDTLQETNGLLDEDRTAKAPMERLRAIIGGVRPD
ncbi:glycoside hydrolase family 2 TIM barrel-domain containing protein [Cryobacterium sp. SO2]|uniref:sugar-binding domain-containing protein n=1 Tax=Cryobacterium sp. SO2 TaxID=1897060 RepID=UPI00223C9CF0|nr:sugar-binding domain-containing protein [Cryobacterium sp. SO2]WEO77788.1 glycoside hydrolase family 2 TIM barrel-domain containing protein [Cryobacterium sp. SO2]